MGLITRKEKEKEMKRNEILDAAEVIFFTKGYNQSTMDDVAIEAEFSKRTVYSYFGSKEQIYFEIMTRGFKLLNNQFEVEMNKTYSDSLEKIQKMGYILYDFSINYPNYFNAIMKYENGELDFDKRVPDSSKEICYKEGDKLLSFLINSISDGIKEGSIQQGTEVIQTALMIWACTIGIFSTCYNKKAYFKNVFHIKEETFIKDSFNYLLKNLKR